MNDRLSALPAMQALPALVQDGSFEDTLAALEAIVAHLEEGRLSLDETLAWYEAGIGLAKRCSEHLSQAELRLSILDAECDALSPRAEARFDDEI